VDVVASLSQGRTAAAQSGLFTHKSAPVIFEPPCTLNSYKISVESSCKSWLTWHDNIKIGIKEMV